MKRQIAIFLCLSMLLLTACQAGQVSAESSSGIKNDTLPRSEATSTSSSDTRELPLSSSSATSTSSSDTNELPLNSSYSSSASMEGQSILPSEESSSVSQAGPAINFTEPDNAQQILITVTKSTLMEEKQIVVSNEQQIKDIVAFVETMFESDFSSPPDTGGTVMEVTITKNEMTYNYLFLEREVEGYRLAKDIQHPDVRNTWYFADAKAYSYLLNLFK